jgi:prophage tail gpP-like protein
MTDVPFPPSRPADFGVAPLPPERPADLGNNTGTNATQPPAQAGSKSQPRLAPGWALDPVTLLVNGKQYGGWEKVTVEASSDDSTRTFSVTTSEIAPDWPIKPMDEVEVLVNGSDQLVKGYVESYSATLGSDAHSVTISGSSKSVDLADSAAEHETGRFRNSTIKEIGDAISKKYNVKIVDKTKKGLKKVERFQLQNGETCYDALERLARREHLFLVGAANGDLEIHDGPEDMSDNSLVEGYFPVIQIVVKLSAKDRHSNIEARGQRAHTDKGDDLTLKAEETDSSVKRYRKKVVHAEGDTDEQGVRDRARNEMSTAQGRSITATVTCTGFYGPDGKLWKPLQQIYCKFPTVHLDQTMAIKAITWSKEAKQRTDSTLELVDPVAVKGDADSKSKSDGAYKVDPPKPDTAAPAAAPTITGGAGHGAA